MSVGDYITVRHADGKIDEAMAIYHGGPPDATWWEYEPLKRSQLGPRGTRGFVADREEGTVWLPGRGSDVQAALLLANSA